MKIKSDFFKISVIIPVFNTSKFVRKAVESAVDITEVGEVILVEDGSTDSSLIECIDLNNQYEKVRLFRHPNGENRGAGASRNLGIEKSTCDYIAFLDADDWYLPNRFTKDRMVYDKFPNADVIYSCSIYEEDFIQNRKLLYGVTEDPRMKWGKEIEPIKFYELKLKSKLVLFNTNSVTIKKGFLISNKCFDTRLRLHQDSELWNRLMRRGSFYAAEWEEPVSVVRKHSGNRITHRSSRSQLKMIAVQIDNIGLDNLHSFEIDDLYSKVIRLQSKGFIYNLFRRVYYYSFYCVNFFDKKNLLEKIRKAYAID
ncbi:glycosyltransferase family 2 protein [Belliella kenyensis]|uniref:Glycosyltransferase family 2 protein n=1 Tax=Belliella kenyensis TaxID=1472724 RepID=A0ABV8EQT9_9BACT|nr:glycosyltransferase family 2 protein [Belliella kenyensis]MCH7402095.1 glycosyltransferase family 2 protein [Belliella kenyensis]MDN3601537.1 glycosyltransferase family 2 protein [Belliella kenyensis]